MGHVLTLSLEYDPDLEDPNDADCDWTLVSFNGDHHSYKDPDDYFEAVIEGEGAKGRVVGFRAKSIGLHRKLVVGTAFILSYYEHGLCRWSLAGEGPQCAWDTTSLAGVLLWNHPPNEMGAKTRADRAKDARYFVERYTAWANGSGYYFSLCDAEDPEELIDASGGYYDVDGEKEYMLSETVIPDIEGHAVANGCERIVIVKSEGRSRRLADLLDKPLDPRTCYVQVTGDAKDAFQLNSASFNLGRKFVARNQTTYELLDAAGLPQTRLEDARRYTWPEVLELRGTMPSGIFFVEEEKLLKP